MKSITHLKKSFAMVLVALFAIVGTFAYSNSTNAANPMTISSSDLTFTQGIQKEFTVTTTPNDDAGEMVRAYFTLPAEMSAEYEQGGTWYPLTNEYGPTNGFPVATATSQFRATFDTAGSFAVTVDFKKVSDNSALASQTFTASVGEQVGMTASSSDLSFREGIIKNFSITTTANDDVDKMVRAYFTLPLGAHIEYKDQNGNYQPLTSEYGPSTGFPVKDTTSDFRATFDYVGTYSIVVDFKEVAGQEETLLSQTFTASVDEQVGMTASSSDLTFQTGVQKEFQITTTANDDQDTLARAYFTLPSGAHVQYQEQNGQWYDLSSEYGPSTGFPISDATSPFRATFDSAGTYPITVEFKDVNNNSILLAQTFTANVNDEVISSGGGNSSSGGGSSRGSSRSRVSTGTTDGGTTGEVLGASTSAPVVINYCPQTQAYQFTLNLAVGSTGTDVTNLQQTLTLRGVYTGPVTGYFGPLTKAAVIKYQQMQGIDPIGLVGPLTRAALNKPFTSNCTSEKMSEEQMTLILAQLKVQLLQLMQTFENSKK